MFIQRIEEGNTVSCLFKSSNILASKYNQEKKELTITFNAGRQYTYSGVDYKDYHRFEMAESQGQIFNKYIKKYPTVKNPDIDPTELLNNVTQILNEQAGSTVSKSS
jgi:hypothetical protein